MFASHHWPRFGQDDVKQFLTMQRDVYRWMHDQTMRLANLGWVPTEIAEELRLPEEFTQSHVQGYYGTVSHNAKSVYTKYMGWYDGNPANLNPHPPVESAGRYLEYMGGAEEVLNKAQKAFDEGDYRWVAQVVNHVVFDDPSNEAARHLQAAALEQMGYQAESATWRNAYLVGAMELRNGSPDWGRIPTRDTGNALSIEQIFDVIGVKFDPIAYGGGVGSINLVITDLNERHVLGVGLSAIYHTADHAAEDARANVTTTRGALARAMNEPDLEGFEVEGDRAMVADFFGTLQIYTTANIIEP
jgi:alkyl sulfatase BDS1-like metallo-beta-lactamase superfamily hydrolase